MSENQIRDPCFEDEIDLFEIAQTLWQGRRFIVIFTLVLAAVAFGISLILPRQYQTNALLVIQQPKLQIKDKDSFSLLLKEPDLNILVEVVKSPSVFQALATDPEIRAAWSESNTPLRWQTLAGRAKASVVGKNGLRLVVQDTDSQRAALLANRWASEAARRINSDYGYVTILAEVTHRVEDAYKRYQEAESTYAQALARNRQAILAGQLKRAQNDLNCVLARESEFQRLQQDLQAFASYLQNFQKDAPLTPGDTLALATLQQRVLASKVCTTDMPNLQTQWQARDLSALTVTDALALVEKMQIVLQQRAKVLSTQRTDLEQRILQLQQALEEERSRLDELAHYRDVSWTTYQSLTQLQTQLETLDMESNNIAVVISEAMAPAKPVSPRTMLNITLAATLGFILSMIWVLISAWWRERNMETHTNDRSTKTD